MGRVQVAGRHRDAHVRHRHHERQRDGRRNCEAMWEHPNTGLPPVRTPSMDGPGVAHSWLTGRDDGGESGGQEKARSERCAPLGYGEDSHSLRLFLPIRKHCRYR